MRSDASSMQCEYALNSPLRICSLCICGEVSCSSYCSFFKRSPAKATNSLMRSLGFMALRTLSASEGLRKSVSSCAIAIVAPAVSASAANTRINPRVFVFTELLLSHFPLFHPYYAWNGRGKVRESISDSARPGLSRSPRKACAGRKPRAPPAPLTPALVHGRNLQLPESVRMFFGIHAHLVQFFVSPRGLLIIILQILQSLFLISILERFTGGPVFLVSQFLHGFRAIDRAIGFVVSFLSLCQITQGLGTLRRYAEQQSGGAEIGNQQSAHVSVPSA